MHHGDANKSNGKNSCYTQNTPIVDSTSRKFCFQAFSVQRKVWHCPGSGSEFQLQFLILLWQLLRYHISIVIRMFILFYDRTRLTFTIQLLHYTRVKCYCNKLTSTDFNRTNILTASQYYDHLYRKITLCACLYTLLHQIYSELKVLIFKFMLYDLNYTVTILY